MALWTKGVEGSVSPEGREPIRSASTWRGGPSLLNRFSASVALPTASRRASAMRSRLSGLSERMSTSIQASKGMEFTEVPPPIRPTLKLVRGPDRVRESATTVKNSMALPRAWEGFTRPKAPHECPPGPRNVTRYRVDPKPMLTMEAIPAPSTSMNASILGPAFSEEVFDPPEVSEALFSDTSQEDEVRIGGHIRGLQGPQDRKNHHETSGIVPDARSEKGVSPDLHGHIGPLGEHGVQVGPQNHRSSPHAAPTKRQDVPDLVDPNGVGSSRLEELSKSPGPCFLLEWRGGDFRQNDEIPLGPGVQALDNPESVLDRGVAGQPRHLCVEDPLLGGKRWRPGPNQGYGDDTGRARTIPWERLWRARERGWESSAWKVTPGKTERDDEAG